MLGLVSLAFVVIGVVAAGLLAKSIDEEHGAGHH